jgi:hypothetical protein
MASILDDLPNLPLVLTDPLSQVLDVISEIIDAVKAMREGKHACEYLIFQVLKFLQSLADESWASDVAIAATRLFALKLWVFLNPHPFSVLIISFGDRNLMEFRDDALRWSRLNVFDRYLMRDNINIAISRHGKKMSDFFVSALICTF